MKKAFLFIVFVSVLLFLLWNPVPVAAAGGTCIQKSGSCPTGYDYSTTVHLTEYGTSTCTPAGAKVPGNGDYDVCCQTPDEINSKFSVQAPLCGSSDELGKANSSCWQCGSTVRCAGADPNLAFGPTDSVIMQSRSPVNPDDPTDRVWRVPGSAIGAEGFTFNGQHYDKPQGDVIVCMSNLTGCGASEVSCSNIRYPEYTTDQQGISLNGQLFQTWGTGGTVETIRANPGSNAGDPIHGVLDLGFLGAIGQFITRTIAATVRYQNDIHEGMSTFERIGAMVENSANQPLLPGYFTPQYSPVDAGDKLGRYPLRGTSLYRLCIENSQMDQPDGDAPEDNVPLRGTTLTEGTLGFTSSNPRFWPQTITGSRLYTTYFLPNAAAAGVDFVAPNGDPVTITQTDENGRTFYDTPYMVEVDDAAYPCGARSGGADYKNVNTDAGGEARTWLQGGGLLSSIVARFDIGRVLGRLIVRSCGPNDSNQCASTPWEIVRSDFIPGDLAVVSQFIGLTPDQLHPEMDPAQRNEIITDGGGNPDANVAGGWTRAFLPQVIAENIEYTHTTAPQGQSLIGGLIEGDGNFDAHPRWLKGVVDAFTCTVDNMIIPSALQTIACPWEQQEPWPGTSDRPLASWTPMQSLPPDFQTTFFQGSVKDAIENATKGKIPACVLEGVKFIESGAEWIGGNSCIINQCGAAGPFQITVGVDGSGDPNCKSCGPSWADGSRTCPDSWPGNWPTDTNASSPCDLQLSANQAVQVLIDKSEWFASQPLNATDSIQSQQEAIMLAADAYWGKTAPVERLGGCTYGEYVYKHCDPSYQCTGNPPYRLP